MPRKHRPIGHSSDLVQQPLLDQEKEMNVAAPTKEEVKKTEEKKEKKIKVKKKHAKKIAKHIGNLWESGHPDIREANKEKGGKDFLHLYCSLGSGDCERLKLPAELGGKAFVVKVKSFKLSNAKLV